MVDKTCPLGCSASGKKVQVTKKYITSSCVPHYIHPFHVFDFDTIQYVFDFVLAVQGEKFHQRCIKSQNN